MDCGHRDIITDTSSGYMVCTQCGLVLDDFIVEEANFHDQQRCSGGQVSIIPWKNMEKARNMISNYTALMHMGDALNATAFKLFEDSSESKLLMKKKLETRCAGCVYYAAKLQGFDRTEKEIATHLSVTIKDLRLCLRNMRSALANRPYGIELLTTVSAERLVQRMVARLQPLLLKHGIDKQALLRGFYKKINSLNSTKGKKPENVCATVLCHVLKNVYNIPVKEVSSTLSISSVVIASSSDIC
jgi:transcription initiation factor TFIIIB Brf1 subunit/transcription initiation factor TFIIB